MATAATFGLIVVTVMGPTLSKTLLRVSGV